MSPPLEGHYDRQLPRDELQYDARPKPPPPPPVTYGNNWNVPPHADGSPSYHHPPNNAGAAGSPYQSPPQYQYAPGASGPQSPDHYNMTLPQDYSNSPYPQPYGSPYQPDSHDYYSTHLPGIPYTVGLNLIVVNLSFISM